MKETAAELSAGHFFFQVMGPQGSKVMIEHCFCTPKLGHVLFPTQKNLGQFMVSAKMRFVS
jgi:hypothetical protein